jgi:hypothetical protein
MKQRNRDEFDFIEKQLKRTIIAAAVLISIAVVVCVIILKQT